MENKTKINCGHIKFRTEDYIVWWSPSNKRIIVSKPDDDLFGETNYGNRKAESPEEALQGAIPMLQSVFEVGGGSAISG